MIVDGIAYTFGIFLEKFVDYYGEGKGRTAWVGSLLSGIYLSAGKRHGSIDFGHVISISYLLNNEIIFVPGPIVSALTNKYGCRAVCMAGSLIGALAFVLSTFSTSVNMLMLTYGVLGGGHAFSCSIV